MDVSKYHTKYPPREHEEAVRMLLEGLEKQTPQSDLSDKPSKKAQGAATRQRLRQGAAAERMQANQLADQLAPASKLKLDDGNETSPASSVDSGSLARGGPSDGENDERAALGEHPRHAAHEQDDDFEFNSEESSSREFTIQVSPQIPSKRGHLTSKSRRASNSPEPHSRFGPPKMRSKATSTTSDSISTSGASSGGHRAAVDEDELNGSYEAIPSRTIAIQCDLKLSSVKRDGYLETSAADLAGIAQASSISSTRYGFYKLSPETLEQRRLLGSRLVSSRNAAHGTAASQPPLLNVNDAPTSMSELSSDEGEDEEGEQQRQQQQQQQPLQNKPLGASGRGRTVGGRSRRDSLPRRPRTALSYVSTSRLRDPHESTEDKSLSDQESEGPRCDERVAARRMPPRSRFMSQQVLSSASPARQREAGARGRARLGEAAEIQSNSDNELNADRFRLPRQEEIVVATKRGRPASGASPQVRRSDTIRNGPLLRRYATLTTPVGVHHTSDANSARPPIARPLDRLNTDVDHDETPVLLSDREVMANVRARRQRGAATNYSTTTDEENQLAASAGETRRRGVVKLSSDEQPRARFSAMSLSRRQPLIERQQDHTRASCNLINSARVRPAASAAANLTTDGSRLEAVHHQPTQDLHRHPHSQSQQRSTLMRAERLNQLAPPARTCPASKRSPIGRSTSMNQGSTGLLAGNLGQSQPVYTTPHQYGAARRQRGYYDPGAQCDYDDCCGPAMVDGQEFARTSARMPGGSEINDLPTTRTWANPSSARGQPASQSHHQSIYDLNSGHTGDDYRRPSGHYEAGRPLTRKSARSHSMRDVNQFEPLEADDRALLMAGLSQRPRRFERIYHAAQELDGDEEGEARVAQDEAPSEEFSVCSASSINVSGQQGPLTRAQAHQPLDFDSQQRLNEIGLPHPADQPMPAAGTKRAPASHLGLSAGLTSRYATTGRGSTQSSRPVGQTLITGRALSQQSLTRPTMPLSRRLRRSGGTSAGSGSDVGGSSMSLVSRLRDGSRYENAHTRTPVVMLIPQATPASKQADLSRSESNSRRASSRVSRPFGKTAGSRVSSQDRSHRRSASRNNSDSESSSSMLRTLVKPRVNRMGSTNRSSRRKPVAGASRVDSDQEENMDGVGRLATEIDSYKFRRRYSVPKDAKINWFSKLKQRVTSKS